VYSRGSLDGVFADVAFRNDDLYENGLADLASHRGSLDGVFTDLGFLDGGLPEKGFADLTAVMAERFGGIRARRAKISGHQQAKECRANNGGPTHQGSTGPGGPWRDA